jgi:hypothetical protein
VWVCSGGVVFFTDSVSLLDLLGLRTKLPHISYRDDDH